jgi:hypothetical protein
MTIAEIKTIAIASPLVGYVAGVGTIVATDTVKQAIEKADANASNAIVIASSAQVGNNLFNFYNFK